MTSLESRKKPKRVHLAAGLRDSTFRCSPPVIVTILYVQFGSVDAATVTRRPRPLDSLTRVNQRSIRKCDVEIGKPDNNIFNAVIPMHDSSVRSAIVHFVQFLGWRPSSAHSWTVSKFARRLTNADKSSPAISNLFLFVSRDS